MKNIFKSLCYLMFLFLMTSVSYAQDTIPTTVIIEEEVDLSKENEDYDDDYHTDDSNSFVINIGSSDSNNSFRIGMVDLGFSSYLSDGQLDLPSELGFLDQRLWRSINVGIHLVNYKVDFNPNSTKNRVGISSGIKWNIVHYSMEQDYNLLRNQPDFVSALDFDVPSLKKNRLKANHLQIPLLLEYNSNSKSSKNSISLAVGYVHQFLLQSNFKYKTDDGEKVKTKGEFNLRKSMGFAEARLGIGPINFYVQYGLADLFQVDAGPELTPINFGINIIPR